MLFLVFAGQYGEEIGGWMNYQRSFDSLPEAMRFASRLDVDWVHIVNTHTKSIVWQIPDVPA